jgi:hypothetical protein
MSKKDKDQLAVGSTGKPNPLSEVHREEGYTYQLDLGSPGKPNPLSELCEEET